MESADLHEGRVRAVEGRAEVGLMQGGEGVDGHPVAAGAGQLFAVEFGGDSGGVEVRAPTLGESEREGEVEGFGSADVGFEKTGGQVDER
jgi:hypothetical protein